MERDKTKAREAVIRVLADAGADAASKGARNAADILYDISNKFRAKWLPKPIEDPKAERVADAHVP